MSAQTFNLKHQAARIPGALYIIIILLTFFAFAHPAFLSVRNIANIGVQSSILLIIALPMTLIIMSEGIDLSMGPVISLCTVVIAYQLQDGGSLVLAIIYSLLLGVAFGILNGVLIAYVKLPPFVVTLGTFGVSTGIALALTDGDSVVNIGRTARFFYRGKILGIPLPVLIAIGAYIVVHFLLYHTRFGVSVFAIGGNREALHLAGVKVNFYHVAIYALGGLAVGVGGVIMTARLNSGHPTVAEGLEFDAIAAVILGGTSFERGEGWLFGTVLGVLAIGIIGNGLNLIAFQSSLHVVSIGLMVILTVVIDKMKVKI